jgi:hypothetical protein
MFTGNKGGMLFNIAAQKTIRNERCKEGRDCPSLFFSYQLTFPYLSPYVK